MKKKIVNFFLMAVMFTAVVGTTVSCKDYEEDMYSDMQGQLKTQTTALQNALAVLQAQYDDLSAKEAEDVEGLNNALAAAQQTLNATIAGLQAALDATNGDVASLSSKVTDLENTLNAYDIAGMWSVYNQLVQYVGSADNYVAMQEALLDFIKEYQNSGLSIDDIAQAVEDAAAAKAAAEANTTLIAGLTTDVETLKNDLEQQKADAEATYQELWDAINSIVSCECPKDEDGNCTCGSCDCTGCECNYEETIQKLQDAVDDFGTRISTLETTVAAQAIQLNNLQSCLNQLVTSIIVQGSKNPVFGTLSLPIGIQSNVLAAYYGTAETSILGGFPTSRAAYYASGVSGLTSDDIKMLGATAAKVSGTLLLGKGNAGTLYVTVNPNTVDYTGVNFSLENSVGEESGVILEGLTPSDTRLNFGYTRSTDNGFYETAATVTEDALGSVVPRVSISDLKDVVSQLKEYVTSKGSSGINVTGILSTLYSNCSDVLDANAVCAAWTDADGVDHKTYSNYEVAATAIKPLSYAFLQGVDYDSFPGFGTIQNYINKFFNKITIPSFDLSEYDFSGIDSIKFDKDGNVTTTVTVHFDNAEIIDQDVNVYDNNGNLIGTGHVSNEEQDIYVDITIDLTEFMDDEYGEINKVIDQINSYLDDINDVIDAMSQINQLADAVDDLQSKLLSYLDKLNTKLCNFINSANKALQPILLVNTTDGFAILSQMQSQPSVLSSGDNIVLIPTSYTDELLAPAYKKLVGVTNVYSISDLSVSAQVGDSDCLSALQKANSCDDIATVLDGNTRQVTLSGLQSGYIYEIAFTAVDYDGKVVADKYYVRVN
ncbi:MAG: hypothetical protein LUD48_05215 [Prevotella sp.]|nr:hypothetical protein [Prevotella sp.]